LKNVPDYYHRQRGWRLFVKRSFDLVLAATVLLALLPVLVVVALLIRLRMGGPILFTQRRPGIDGRPFTVSKFRTMRDARDKYGRLLPDGERLTTLGRLLRGSSIDEFPQLWNVVKGEMSLVGPRPLLMEYLDRYTPEQARRHEVMPGVTGWAQVNGRNALTWEQKFALDTWYVEHWSLMLDAKILAMTASRVLRREGIANQGHATMPEFVPGNEQ
jgi:lipopolysaccharide/colanic/teichoic acid biosynthesis glycosyltransferase